MISLRLGPAGGKRRGRQVEKGAENLVARCLVELGGLIDRRLDDADRQAADRRNVGQAEPEIAEADMRGDEQQGKRQADADVAIAGKQRRHREHEDRERVHADHADHRYRLHQQRRRHCGIADRIPGKAGEQKGAQPLEQRERGGECGDAADIVGPEQPRQRRRQTVEDRENGRQQDDCDRQRPGEAVGLDQHGAADPPQPGDEIAEAEPPADRECRTQAAQKSGRTLDGRTVEQPDENRKGNEADRKEIVGRLRENRQRAGQERHERAPPTPQQYEPAGKAFQEMARLKRIAAIDLAARRYRSKP